MSLDKRIIRWPRCALGADRWRFARTAAGRSTRVAFAGTVVELSGVDGALLGADDFLFRGDVLLA